MANLLPKIFPRSEEQRIDDFRRSLVQKESVIGGQLFGPIPKGHKRQFFCLDEKTWIWYEEWTDNGKSNSITTRYDVRPTGIIKSQDGQSTQLLSSEETINLYKAAEAYYRRVSSAYQRILGS